MDDHDRKDDGIADVGFERRAVYSRSVWFNDTGTERKRPPVVDRGYQLPGVLSNYQTATDFVALLWQGHEPGSEDVAVDSMGYAPGNREKYLDEYSGRRETA